MYATGKLKQTIAKGYKRYKNIRENIAIRMCKEKVFFGKKK